MRVDSLKDYISTKEASKRYGLTPGHLWHLVNTGAIDGIQVARDWLFYVPSLETYMKNRPKPGPKPGRKRVDKEKKTRA
jgi:hypothetical protein